LALLVGWTPRPESCPLVGSAGTDRPGRIDRSIHLVERRTFVGQQFVGRSGVGQIDDVLATRVRERQQQRAEETEGLVDAPLPTPMLQPWEVYDQDLFDLEMIRVFGRSWVWLGDTEDLREPGDFITALIGQQPVVVIKQKDGSVKGFLDNCRHRAAQITPANTGAAGALSPAPTTGGPMRSTVS
jgi:hypothetical protein